jgi:indole-3-glycerol phosphate synthase
MSASTPTVLGQILQSTREQLRRRKLTTPAQALEEQLASALARREQRAVGSLSDALTQPGIAVIAEFKRRSPSAGELRENADLTRVVRAYELGGASALSVLTEGPNFGGSLEDLRAAREACGLPILRKDFVVERYQLHEALLAGADAVLLIVAALSPQELESLHRAALELSLEVLVEVHDREELAVALSAGASLIGINNRDLRDFSVDLDRTSLLMAHMPPGVTVVSESGIASGAQLASLERDGVDAVLVGERLMRAADPAAALLALRTRGPRDERAADLPSERI